MKCVALFYSLPLMLLFFSVLPASSAMYDQDVVYTDYAPRYRNTGTDFLLEKIEYAKTQTHFYFRYVAQHNGEQYTFAAGHASEAWRLTPTARVQGRSTAIASQETEVYNIRVNNGLRVAKVLPGDQKKVTLQKGDILTCRITSGRLPQQMRTLNLENGPAAQSAQPFTCSDIMVKNKSSYFLGDLAQMRAIITAYYKKVKFVTDPSLIDITSLTNDKSYQAKLNSRQTETPLKTALEPIDYMPRELKTVADLRCQERVILTNVNFLEDKAVITGRARSNRTLAVVVQHLRANPGARIVLHGHTDVHGDAWRNLELSRERAELVKRLLSHRGIDGHRVIVYFHGGKQPLLKYQDGGSANRRVEVEVICE